MNWPKIEIAQLSKLCHASEVTLKVILEIAHLNSNQLIEACQICQDAGADFVKTSTGYGGTGASVGQIEIMRNILSSSVGIIASGSFITLDETLALIQAGADRVASTNALAILQEWQQLQS
jgi:deoxyribose-phosphate aldolase